MGKCYCPYAITDHFPPGRGSLALGGSPHPHLTLKHFRFRLWKRWHRLVLLSPNQNWSPWPELHDLGIERCYCVTIIYLALIVVCSCVCVCVCIWQKSLGPASYLFPWPLQMVVHWVVLAAAGRAWSYFGASSSVGWMALSSSLPTSRPLPSRPKALYSPYPLLLWCAAFALI